MLETNLDKIDVGKLFLVTYKGGTLGREGDHHVIIPDINVSKAILIIHMSFYRSRIFNFLMIPKIIEKFKII